MPYKATMEAFNTKLPHVYFQEGASLLAGKLAKEAGATKAFIVRDPGLKSLGVADDVIKSFVEQGIEIVEFNDVVPDPVKTDVNKGGKLAIQEKVDCIVGIGGGSAMDTAKGTYALRCNPEIEDVTDICYGGPGKMQPFKSSKDILLIEIPTTSGTGSEISYVSVITHEEAEFKMLINSYAIMSDYALVDPVLDVGLPAKMTAACGMDLLGHAIESFFQGGLTPGLSFNQWAETMALSAISIGVEYLPKVMGDLKNLEYRAQIKFACLQAGNAMGVGGLMLGHGIGQSLGAIWHIPHGLGVAYGMVPTIRQGAKLDVNDKSRCLKLAKAFYLELDESSTKEEIVDAICKKIEDLQAELEIPTFRELGYKKEEWFDKCIAAAMREMLVTIPCTEDEVKEYYEYLFSR